MFDASYPSANLDSVPRRRERLASILVDDCRVLLDEETGDGHHLDAVATLMWDRFDGSATLGQHAAELSRATGVDVQIVEQAALRLAHALTRAGLLDRPVKDGPAASTPVADPATTRYVPVPPGTCQSRVDEMGWTRTVAVRFGRYHLGLRANDEHAAAILESMFRHYLVDDERVPPNFSVRLILPCEQREAKRLSLLFEGCQLVARNRVAQHTLDGLLEHLSWYVRPPERKLLAVDGAAVMCGRRAVLLPSTVRASLLGQASRLGRCGMAVLDAPATLLDSATGELVVRASAIDVDPMALSELQLSLEEREAPTEPRVSPGRYTLEAWIFHDRRPGGSAGWGDSSHSAASALLRALPSIINVHDLGAQQTLEMLATVLSRKPQETLAGSDPHRIVRLLTSLLRPP